MNKKKRIRNKPIQFYVTESELKKINERIKESGLSKSEYFRRIALKSNIVKVDLSYLNDLIYEVNKIGVNINQVATRVNETKIIYKSEIEDLQEQLEEINEMIREKL